MCDFHPATNRLLKSIVFSISTNISYKMSSSIIMIIMQGLKPYPYVVRSRRNNWNIQRCTQNDKSFKQSCGFEISLDRMTSCTFVQKNNAMVDCNPGNTIITYNRQPWTHLRKRCRWYPCIKTSKFWNTFDSDSLRTVWSFRNCLIIELNAALWVEEMAHSN